MNKKYPTKRGVSLVELMVASAIIGLILISTGYLLKSSFRHYREIDSAAQVHQLAMTAMTRLDNDLKHGNKSSYRLFTSPIGIVFASPRNGTD